MAGGISEKAIRIYNLCLNTESYGNFFRRIKIAGSDPDMPPCTHYKKPPVNEKDMPPVYLTGHIRIDRWLLLLHPLFPHKCDCPHFLPLYIVDTGDASAVVRQFLIIYEFLFHLSINFICRTFDVTGLAICIAVGQDVTD